MAIIAISRKIASYGDETALALAQSMHYRFIDKKDLENDLIQCGVSTTNLKRYDERKPGFWASLSRNRDEYLDYLREIIYTYAQTGNCIFIGRGGFALLQDIPGCYAVRLVASDITRVHRLMQEFDWPEKKARLLMTESDVNRNGFHKCFFDMEQDDAAHYHLVVNTDSITADTAAGIIEHAVMATITKTEEQEGMKRISELLMGQRIVNHIAFKLKLQIYFLDAEVTDQAIVLHGVADTALYIDQALKAAREMAQGKLVSSQITMVNEYKPRP
ncbi:MAG: cytidylate kinase family protein [Treponema sp.]